ncbi:MAG TPA: response regulator [Gemmataceae bacterium]|nr:response regulator [Gemmataceae bacterium]
MASQSRPFQGKTILVVEEEEGIRSLLQLILVNEGFKVLLTGNGQDALNLYRDQGSTIDLVLMDVRMQHLDGPTTFTALRSMNDQVRCCFMTGDASSDREQELLALGGLHVFRKPFPSLSELIRTIQRCLD